VSGPTSPSTTGAVFLSYAREDTDAARRIADALRGFGVEVWFDQSELRGGDAWDQKIRRQIKDCALFLPVISQHTQARGEGYFRLEWKLAVERTHLMAEGMPFLAPVAIDDAHESDAIVPPEFMRVHWTRLKDGLPTSQFVEQIKHLLEAPRVAAGVGRGLPTPPGSGATGKGGTAGSGDPALQPSRAEPPEAGRRVPAAAWAVAIVAIIVVVLIGWRMARPSAESAPVSSSNAGAGTRPPDLSSSNGPTAEKTAASLDDKSVAVLAFADLSEARNSEYFSDGISEELLNVLAKVPGLRVAARTSAFFFKGKNLPITEIAAKLNVAYVVEGSVQRAGDSVRITAQLIKAADGFHVWSEHFDRDLKNVFAVQDEIAGLIAKQLSLKLGASSVAAIASVNPQAFELYLQGRQAWNLRTPEGFAHAEELLNRALALEPTFARAHAALADVWLLSASSVEDRIGTFDQRNSPAVARIQAQIERALALDPNLADAHATLGNLRWQCWQLDEAVRELRLAIALNPNYAPAHQWLGRVLLSDGRFDEAVAAMRRAAELDPLSHRIVDNYAIALFCVGRIEEALAVDERALALQPDSVQAAVWKALMLAGLGRHEEAVALTRRVPYANSIYATYACEVFARAGLKAEAEQVLAGLTGRWASFRFIGLAALGRPEEMLAMDPTALPMQPFHEVLLEPAFDPIRRDPRFVEFLATLGMTEAHARAQAWRAAHPVQIPAKK